LPELIESLFNQGAKMRFLAELITALNGRILRRLYEITVPEDLQSRMCLLVLGSEGRGEQLLRTDQDNALVLADEIVDGIEEGRVRHVAEQLSAAIEACGWPPCPGEVMVRNANWRGTAQDWTDRISRWLATPTPEAMLNLAILVDARAVAGKHALLRPIGERLVGGLGQEIALRGFADPAVRFHTPLSWLGRIKGGEAGTDLKKGAIFPIVHGLRALALANAVTERNSFRRAEALIRLGQLSAGFGRDLQQALAVCLRLRLATQLEARTPGDDGWAGKIPDNRIHVERLRRLDRELLRDALRVVNDFQDHLKQRFHLDR
jgi:CBS domain-containing protein